ncbi:MAG: ABC-F family ATP-binding cassette domain-containing protein [Erysipelotrichaceae bacterium]
MITLDHATKKVNVKTLFQDVQFVLEAHEKVGLIGVNGTGKSTLLKILAKKEPVDGTLMFAKDLRVGYLSQHEHFPKDISAIDYVLGQIPQEKREEAFFEARKTLHRFGIADEHMLLSHMSGGAKKRVALSALMVNPYDVLLLDEPTNHLDEHMILYLEKFLIRFSGAIVLVSHDRYFLERIVSRIVEIDRQKLYSYPGNYAAYLEGKSARMQADEAAERKRMALYRQEAKWAAQGAQGRGTKSKQRLERFAQLCEQKAPAGAQNMQFVTQSQRLGRKVLEIEHLEKRVGERVLIRDFSYTFTPSDRVGIMGPNGCGKSTLLELVAQTKQVDGGSIVMGETVKLGYFRQHFTIEDDSMRLIDYIQEVAHVVQTMQGEMEVGKLMELFLFPKSMQYQTIATLSGGEKRRLYLLRILAEEPNVLLLDEPTNDFDLATLTVLESYLDTFMGMVIVVSHDRYFLDKVCDRLFVFQNDGTLKQYLGGYSDYIGLLELEKEAIEKREPKGREPKNMNLVRFTYEESKDFETIDATLQEWEEKLAAIDEALQAAGSDFDALHALSGERDAISAKLDHINERWLYLYEKEALIQEQKNRNK